MLDRDELRKLHAIGKEKVENGRPHYDRIAGTAIIPAGSRNYHIVRPHDMDAFQIMVHTNMDDYNDPIPVMKDLDMMIAKLQQLKMSFAMAWEREMTKVTLEEVNALEEKYERANVARRTFAQIAIPLCQELWNNQLASPGSRLRAIGVCHQDFAELTEAAVQQAIWDEGAFVNLMYKGIPIVQDDRARTGVAVPIYRYGQSNIANINFKPDPIGQLLLGDDDVEQQPPKQEFCGNQHHRKECRCHLGWRVKK